MKKIYDEDSFILDLNEVANKIFLITLISKNIVHSCLPGQFINLTLPEKKFPFLRRPFSIYNINKNEGIIEILVKRVGEGTNAICSCKKFDKVKILGPLGNGFTLSDTDHIIFAAGGIGLPPLYFAYNTIRNSDINYTFYYGAKTKSELVSNLNLNIPENNLIIATDDGSEGKTGTLVEIIENQLKARGIPENIIILSCGPEIMLKKLAEFAREYNIKTEVSMETVMGCGFGVCQGCALKVNIQNEFSYKLVCKDGPVFNSNIIVWDQYD